MTLDRLKGSVQFWLFPIIKVIDRVTWVVLFLMMLMTMIDVLLRKFTNLSILGTVELTELMMVIVIFGSLAQCEVDGGHIKVDLILKRLKPRTQAIIDVFTQLACSILFALMTWALFLQASDIKEWGEVTMDLRLPLYPFVYIASFGCAVLVIALSFKTLMALIEVIES